MTESEILTKLTSVFRDVLDNDTLSLTEATTANDVEGWDSLAHVDLIVAIEKAFKISFTTKEVRALTNVGDLVRLISGRTI